MAQLDDENEVNLILATYTNTKTGEQWDVVSGSLWLALKTVAVSEGVTFTLDSENCRWALEQVPRPEEI